MALYERLHFDRPIGRMILSMRILESCALDYDRVYWMGSLVESEDYLKDIEKQIDDLYSSEVIMPINGSVAYNRKIYIYSEIIAELEEANKIADEKYKKLEKYFNKKLRYK